jgi:uncharacterized protein (TIGR03435 family)
MRTPATLSAAVVIFATLSAQSKPPEFGNVAYDVVSIKLNKSGESGGRWGRQPGGRWVMVNTPIAVMISQAYPTKVEELFGAPDWVRSEPYDVEARATFEPTIEQQRTMLRALLADRFKLAAHYEARERPIYNLVVVRADKRLGPRLRYVAETIDCATYKPKTPTDPPVCGARTRAGSALSFTSGGLRMASLGDMISNYAGRPIVDKTGLTGFFELTLEFGPGPEGLSIFTALQEQLGLKLEPARGLLDVVVIDRIERPTEN